MDSITVPTLIALMKENLDKGKSGQVEEVPSPFIPSVVFVLPFLLIFPNETDSSNIIFYILKTMNLYVK